MIDLLSNNSHDGLTLDRIRQVTEVGVPDPATQANISPEPSAFKLHRLEARLGPEAVAEVVRLYESGESATAIAKDLDVAPSALIRLLRKQNAVVRRQVVSSDDTQELAREYEAGATMAELEKKHRLSHGAVLRALRRAGVQMRAKAPRRKAVSLVRRVELE